MTLSNFDWTDKNSVRWFVLLPTGHEGPYSLEKLKLLSEEKKLALDVKIWAEGLAGPVRLTDAMNSSLEDVVDVPDLPPIPTDDIPPLPLPEDEEGPKTEESYPEVEKRPGLGRFKMIGAGSIVVLLMCFFIFSNYKKDFEKIEIRRRPKMTVNLHEKILQENIFDRWDKPIFFKEYLSDDHSHIWLVTSSFQTCKVTASFKSIKDKLLSVNDETVSFKTQGDLINHLVEFSSFEFGQGSKIIPGLYELDIRATDCQWDGFVPKLMNMFRDPDKDYAARTKVVLFSKGAVEFNSVLDRLVKKKFEIEEREKNQNEVFWQDLQQKFETLQAITLQIEQLFLDFLDKDAVSFNSNLKPMVDQYTKQFGSFLTSFVVENENYFKNLEGASKGISQKRNYELMVRLTAKKIGLESMKYIEEFQKLKTPKRKDLAKFEGQLKKTFNLMKSEISEKIIQVSEDRSDSP